MSREARQEIERYIKEHATEYFTKDRSGKGYICPICGSGSGVHGTGITTKDGEHFTCWAGCFTNADIFEIIGLQNNLTDFNEIFNQACEIFNISPYDANFNSKTANTKAGRNFQSDTHTAENFTEFYSMAEQKLTQTDYHRGISLETLRRFHVGFIPQWRHPKAGQNIPTSPRLIIPIWKGGYLARDTRANLTDTQREYAKMRVGTMRLFNQGALTQSEKPVFIVEGEIDALSIMDAGGQAVALCSVANVKKLLEAVKAQPPKVGLIITLDTDKAGEGTAPKLMAGLKELNFFSYRQIRIPEPYKDANEFLMNDRERFTAWVKECEKVDFEVTKEEIEQEEQQEREEFEREAVVYYLNDFLREVKLNREGRAIPTGFENLDSIFGGGLYPGLYTVGANSSIGKTTLILQIADNISRTGQGVLIFSLEMSRNELIAKSLSRLSFLKNNKLAKTTRGILRGDLSTAEQSILTNCIQEYLTQSQNMYIFQGVGDVGVSTIKDKAEKYMKYSGKAPVIVIDYLQILAPYNEKYTDKQNTDKNILELKRLSRDFQIPVIGISSFNRESYKAPVSMASFKESGAIEYSSDVLIALQYDGWDYRIEVEEKEYQRMQRIAVISQEMERRAKTGKSQRIQGKILKNRNGGRGSVYFDFWPMFNYFQPCKEEK